MGLLTNFTLSYRLDIIFPLPHPMSRIREFLFSFFCLRIKLLNEFILMQKLEPIGAIKIARYNPPWTLPFFRRNELMVKINPNIKSLRQMDNEIKNQE